MQVEFVMLDPYVRLPLEHDGKGTFSVRFQVGFATLFVLETALSISRCVVRCYIRIDK